jgi:hypothetical protein
MSEPTFTPGPWHVTLPMHGNEVPYRCVQIGADEMYSTLEMKPADAALIAVAPDLYFALAGLIEDLETCARLGHVPNLVYADAAPADGGSVPIGRCLTALRKARGEP